MSRPEILAPAGDRPALAAALAAGADAVYFGLDDGFNARARAVNFPSSPEAGILRDTVQLVHRANARAFITLNTLVFEPELPIVEELLRRVAAAGVDAIIVQDPAVALLARAICPALEIHGSTQMTASSALAAELLRPLGLSRIVVPRELSVDEIRAYAAGTSLELEVFVHGALCVAWSGQCLSSEAWGGRSANRGQCAQACRLPYELVVDGAARDLGDVAYLLSPKDLAGADAVPALAEIGVASLKIEGRLKGPSYVAATVARYREALESAANREPLESEANLEPANREPLEGEANREPANREALLANREPVEGEAVANREPLLAKREALAPEAGWTSPVAIRTDVASLEIAYTRGNSQGFLGGADHQALVEGRFPRHRGLALGRVVRLEVGAVVVERDPAQRPITGGLALGQPSTASGSHAPADFVPRAGMGVVFDRSKPADPEEGGPIFGVDPLAGGRVRLHFGRPGPDLDKVKVGDFVWVNSDPEITKSGDAAVDAGQKPLGRIPIELVVRGSVGQSLEVVARRYGGESSSVSTGVSTAGTNAGTNGPQDPMRYSPATVAGHTLVELALVELALVEPALVEPALVEPALVDTWASARAASASKLQPARGGGLTRELLADKLGSFGGSDYHLARIDLDGLASGLHLPVSELKEVRRELVTQLDALVARVDREVRVDSVIDEVRDAVTQSVGRIRSDEAIRDAVDSDIGRIKSDGSTRDAAVDSGIRRIKSDGPQAIRDATVDSAGVGIELRGTTGARAASQITAASSATLDGAIVVPLCRNDAQLDALIAAGAREVELDWMELVGLGKAVARAKAAGLRVGVATVRVQKPGEERIDAHLAKLEPDHVLVRSWGSLAYFKVAGTTTAASATAASATAASATAASAAAASATAASATAASATAASTTAASTTATAAPTLHGDFSLNVTNSITAAWVLGHGLATITAAHDLDRDQLLALLDAAPRGRVAVTIHHHIPTFHTEHCVYAHLLSTGKDFRTCGRPCEHHQVALRDRVGLVHPVVVDVGCRNTVFNAQAQSAASLVPELLAKGVRRFRIELVRETAEETRRVYEAYRALVAGELSSTETVRRAAVHEQFGVTKGTMRTLTVLR